MIILRKFAYLIDFHRKLPNCLLETRIMLIFLVVTLGKRIFYRTKPMAFSNQMAHTQV